MPLILYQLWIEFMKVAYITGLTENYCLSESSGFRKIMKYNLTFGYWLELIDLSNYCLHFSLLLREDIDFELFGILDTPGVSRLNVFFEVCTGVSWIFSFSLFGLLINLNILCCQMNWFSETRYFYNLWCSNCHAS